MKRDDLIEAMLAMAKHFNLVSEDCEVLPYKNQVWNRIIWDLEQYYPGWRGYKIQYKNGRVG